MYTHSHKVYTIHSLPYVISVQYEFKVKGIKKIRCHIYMSLEGAKVTRRKRNRVRHVDTHAHRHTHICTYIHAYTHTCGIVHVKRTKELDFESLSFDSGEHSSCIDPIPPNMHPMPDPSV